jgi:hypothetical protein
VHYSLVGGMMRMNAAVGIAAAGNTLLFSSLASMLGSGGQANYVAANGWLDSWAVGAVNRGQSATSVEWGAWSGGGGMAANDAGTIQRMERLGVGAVEPSRGLAVIEVWSPGQLNVRILRPSLRFMVSTRLCTRIHFELYSNVATPPPGHLARYGRNCACRRLATRGDCQPVRLG